MNPPLSPEALARILKEWKHPQASRWYPSTDTTLWLQYIARRCQEYHIPQQQWSIIAIHFLEGDLKIVMEQLQDHANKDVLEVGWVWESFTTVLTQSCDEAKNHTTPKNKELNEIEKFIRDHPFLATTAGVTLIGAGSIVVAPTIALGLLNFVGISSLGPVGGSFAATIQSIVYGGTTGGVFSALQGFAMTTAAASSTTVAGAVAAITGGTWFIRGTGRRPDGR